MKIDYLYTDGIVGKDTKVERMFLRIEKHYKSNMDIPSQYVKKMWEKYKGLNAKGKGNSMNGKIFEVIIMTILVKEKITPFYAQAQLEFVPNIDYDIILFPRDKKGNVDVSAPICLSLKTSLRERYKQADLEGLALKEVYKRAVSYLITLESDEELINFNYKVQDKDIRGIDRFICATSKEFDELIEQIKELTVAVPPEIKAVKDAKEIES